MKKKRRTWLIVVASCAAFVAVLFYLAVREDPRYVAASLLLEENRAKAEERFAPLTWEEYRDQNGSVFSDDRDKWDELFRSFPIDVGRFAGQNSPKYSTSEETFLAYEQFFDVLPEEVARLKVHYVSDGGVIWTGSPLSTKGLAMYIGIAIEATAGLGRIEDLRRYVRSGFQIVEHYMDEPSEISVLIGNSIQIMVTNAVLRAAVKNRRSPEVVSALEELLDNAPLLPDPRDISAGEVRAWEDALVQLRKLKSNEVGPWLDNYRDYGTQWKFDKGSPLDRIKERWEDFTSGEEAQVRRTGARTTAALEARLWEVLLARADALRSVSFETGEGTAKAKALDYALQQRDDPSYELADELFPIYPIIQTLMSRSFIQQGADAVIELVKRFPDYESLPEGFPSDVSFIDPFGNGSPVLYKKTPTGFVVYTRFRDRHDDGFVFDDPAKLDRQYYNGLSSDRKDYGIVVNYELPTTAP